MTPQEIISEAQLQGVRIILNPSGGISLVGNTSIITDSFKSLVTVNREEIIDYLTQNNPLPAGVDPNAKPTTKYVVGQNNMVFTTVTGPTTSGVIRAEGLTSASAGVKFPADLYPPISNPFKRAGLSGGVTSPNIVNTFNGGTGDITFTVNGSTGSNVTGATMFNVEVVSTFNGATGTIEGVNTFNGATGTIEGVNSVNGQTGAVTLVDLIGVSTVNGVSGDVQVVSSLNGATGVVEAVTSFNGNTGAVEGISSINGGTGSVAAVNTFNSVAGAVEGVNTFNGDTGAIEGVNTFNGNTGTIEGVASVNGATGAVTNIAAINATNLFSSNQEFAGSVAVSGGISMQTSGITFPDGTHQSTAFRAGLKYTVTHTGAAESPSAGGIKMASNISGTAVDILSIHDTDANGNDISSIMTLFASNGGFVQILKEDGTELLIAAIDAGETGLAGFSSSILTITATSGIEVDTSPSVNDVVYVYVIPNLVTAVQTIGGATGNIQVSGGTTGGGLTMETIANVGYLGIDSQQTIHMSGISTNAGVTFADGSHLISGKEVAHFTIQSSSGIAADEKLDALKFIPFNATVKEVGVRTSITGGVTASFVQAGTDPFGAATTGARTLATIELGQTGNDFGFTSSTISSSAITGSSFVYLDITSISGGITGIQAFMTFEGT